MKKLLLCYLLMTISFSCLLAQTSPQKTNPDFQKPLEQLATTHHQINLNGKPFKYSATAGYMPVKDDSGKHKANIFFIAYQKAGIKDFSKRPLTFSFNGGPGSSSVWLHLGALGPKRVLMSDEGQALPPPYQLVENEYTWLDMTDLVFIDPVGTGYSRPVSGEKGQQFWGVKEDVRWVAEFIRMYVTRNQRWSSPKFLIGESYGTTRAAGLSDYLQSEHGMYLNGILLVSAILNFQTARFTVGNDLPCPLFLPTYTATAWYHQKLPADLQTNLVATLRKVEKWALTEYVPALAKGSELTETERIEVIDKLARFTGLSKKYIKNTDLRINIRRFVKELLRDEQRTVGRLDSRFKGTESDWVSETYEYDPSYAAIQGPYTATLNNYVRTELKFECDLPYEILTGKVRPWNWGENRQGFVNVAEDLRKAMSKNPYLKLFVACGYYDLATPYFAAIYTINHLGLDSSLRKNITLAFYEAGHMMYIQKKSLQKLKVDAATFMGEAIQQL